nr:MAG TPA: capsid [Picobirnaviridae sp.]
MKGNGKKRSATNSRGGKRENARVNSKDRKNFKASNDQSEVVADSYPSHGRDNDPSWYAANPQLLKDYASYPFGYPLGTSYPLKDTIYSTRVPGVMALNFAPTIGVATDETSPINVAMRKLYSFVRYANSGAKNYDAPDLMLYIVAVDSAHMYLEYLKRAYGVMMNYTAFNRYYPRALISAMRLNYDDLEANLANFRGYINQFAVKLNQLWIPNGFSFVKRHQWLCQHIYVDSPDSYKAQTYFFNPLNFYQFVVSGSPAVGSCTRVNLPSSAKLENIIAVGNNILDPLITNEDIGIMAGDILKAYGAANMLPTYGIDENYRVLPEYSEEVMSSIENMTFLWMANLTDGSITQDTSIGGGFLKSTPKVSYEISKPAGSSLVAPTESAIQNLADAIFKPVANSRFLNLHKANPTPEDVIVATRGTALVDLSSAGKGTTSGGSILFSVSANVDSCGSELFMSATIYYITEAGVSSLAFRSADWTVVDTSAVDAVASAVADFSTNFALMEQFDWHPLIDFCLLAGAEQEYSWAYPRTPFVDSDTFTYLDAENLANMHSVALLSEFTVPMVQ